MQPASAAVNSRSALASPFRGLGESETKPKANREGEAAEGLLIDSGS
jgi:hypothetical protein